jgi:hypothetical protein
MDISPTFSDIFSHTHQKLSNSPGHRTCIQSDLLSDVFSIDSKMRNSATRLVHVHLGLCLENICHRIFRAYHSDTYQSKIVDPLIRGGDLSDMGIETKGIEIKYRMNSKTTGHADRLAAKATGLLDMGYEPHMLVFRADNFQPTLTRCREAGWNLHIANDFFTFIKTHTNGYDLAAELRRNKDQHTIKELFNKDCLAKIK